MAKRGTATAWKRGGREGSVLRTPFTTGAVACAAALAGSTAALAAAVTNADLGGQEDLLERRGNPYLR